MSIDDVDDLNIYLDCEARAQNRMRKRLMPKPAKGAR